MKGNFRRGLKHYTSVFLTVALIFGQIVPASAAEEIEGYSIVSEEESITEDELVEDGDLDKLQDPSDELLEDNVEEIGEELSEDLLDESFNDDLSDNLILLSEDSIEEESILLSEDKVGDEVLSEDLTDAAEDIEAENADHAVSYDNNAVATPAQLEKYPGVYRVKAKKSENGTMTIGIPSLAQLNAPTVESPAIIMGAAVPYEKKTGPTEYTPIEGGSLYAPYSYFRYKIIEEANLNGTGGYHRKMSGFDGTYVIIRVDVSDIIKDAEAGSYLHVKQSHNKALMVLLGQDVSEGVGTFSDAGGNKTYSYSLSDNAVVMKDKDGNDKATPYLDVVVMSSGTLVQGADTGSTTPDPLAPQADFDLSFYIDKTYDYDPNIEWNSSLGTAVNKETGEAITIPQEETSKGITASDKVLAKYFDETKAESGKISKYKVKGSDIELEMMVENEENAATESGKTEYWSLKKSMEYDKFNGHALKLICEAPLLDSINVKGNPNANPRRHVILDVNSFDIQLANHSTSGAAALTVDGATLTIQDTFNTTGAELAVGNNAKMEIKNKGRFIISDTAQLEIEYDAASVSAGSASGPSYESGVINVNTGGVIENRGIISVEGKEGKPQNAGDVVVRDYKNAKMTIDNGGTLENYGCLLVNGEFYNLGTVKNYGKYDETITSNDPDKGTFTYHKGIQLSWKDDITQGHTFAGEMYNGINDIGTVYNTAQLINEGDLVMVPGFLENNGKIDNKGNIYMSSVDEVVIPITALADKPLVTEQRVRLGYFEDSVILNDQGAMITNSGRISPASVAVVSNGRTGTLSANINRNPGGLNIHGYGSVANTGTINIDALYVYTTVTNKGEGKIDKVFLCRESNYSGKLTESSKNKTKVLNGVKKTSGSTDTWIYAGMDSLTLENRIIKEPVDSGNTVKWRFRAETPNTGKDIVFQINAMMLSPYKDIASFDLPANKTVEIVSPKLPDITGNAVYYFYAEADSGEGYAYESASVKVKGTGLINPTAMQNLVYNGRDQELVTQGSYEGGSILYKLDGGEYGTAVPKAKNAGTYNVTWKTSTDNTEHTITVTIGKRKAYLAADDKASKKGADPEALTFLTYGIVQGDDLNVGVDCTGLNKDQAGEYTITLSYGTSNQNYDIKKYDGIYTVMDTVSTEAPTIKAQAVMGGFDNVASTISVNYVYKPTDKSKAATVYYSLSQNLTKDNYNVYGTTTAPTFGGMGDQLIHYYVHTPDGGAGGSKPVVKIMAEQKAPDISKFTVMQEIKGMGITVSGCEARKTEYRRADEENYTMAMSELVEGFRGVYYVRYAGDGVHYEPSPDIKLEMPAEKPVTACFDSKGGTSVTDVSNLIYGDTIPKPAVSPVKDGYRFVCWCLDEQCNEEYDFERLVTTADQDNKIYLYAKWVRIIPDASDDDSDEIRKDIGDDDNLDINKSTSGKVSSNTVTVSGSKISEVRTDEDGKVTVNSQIWVGGLLDSYTYSGLAIKPTIHVYDGVKKLTEKVDYTLSYKNNKNAGRVGTKNSRNKSIAPTIIIRFKGNYQGNATRYIEFNIAKAELGKDVTVHDLSVAVLKKNKAQKPVPVITMVSTGKTLSAKLFDISYSPTVSAAGIYKVTVKSKAGSNFDKSATADITVVSDKNLMLGRASVSIKPNSYIYTGLPIEPAYSAFTIKIGKNILRPDVDYIIKDIYNNTEPGTATVVFGPALGSRYVGTRTATFKIKNGRVFNNYTKSAFKYDYNDSVPFAKGGAKPEVRVYDRGILLKEKVDYTVTYKNNKAVANKNAKDKKGRDIAPQIIIKGKGKYKGSIRLPYEITKQDIKYLDVFGADQFFDMTQYKAKYKKAKITITDLDGKKLGTKDFQVFNEPRYAGIVSKNNITVTVSVNGIGNYKGTKDVTFRLIDKSRNIARSKVMNKIPDQYYTGNEITLSRNDLARVLYTGKKASPYYLKYVNDITKDDFEIIGYSNNIKKGTAKVTVRGLNGFAGTRTISFKIVSKKTGFIGALIGGKWRK